MKEKYTNSVSEGNTSALYFYSLSIILYYENRKMYAQKKYDFFIFSHPQKTRVYCNQKDEPEIDMELDKNAVNRLLASGDAQLWQLIRAVAASSGIALGSKKKAVCILSRLFFGVFAISKDTISSLLLSFWVQAPQ
jgi:hypothetical protein